MHRRLLLAASAGLLAGAGERVPVAALPIPRLDTRWWHDRHLAKLAEARRQPVRVVWLGDSITENWEMSGPPAWRDFQPAWQHFYGDRGALNLGFKGDTTANLLWRIGAGGELDGLSPKLAIVLIGANNFGRVHWNAEQTLAGIDAVLTETRRRMPGAALILLSVLPSIRSKYVSQMTRQTNAGLAARYGTDPAVHFVDLTALFETNGTVDRTQFLDDQLTPPDPPLHPTAQAQRRIAVTIEPLVARLLGDTPRA